MRAASGARLAQGAVAALYLIGSVAAARQSDLPEYVLGLELWIDGTLRQTPVMRVEAGRPVSISQAGDDGLDGYRIEMTVEPPLDLYDPDQGAVWLLIAISERIDGEWEELADTLLTVASGGSGRFYVVEDGVEPTPQTARVFLQVEARRAD